MPEKMIESYWRNGRAVEFDSLNLNYILMEIVHVYDIDFNWNLEDFRKFEGTNQENLIHLFAISPQAPNDPDYLYVNVEIQKVIDNDKFGRVFTATGTTTFKVKNNNQIPSVKFCFDLLDARTFEFAKACNAKKPVHMFLI